MVTFTARYKEIWMSEKWNTNKFIFGSVRSSGCYNNCLSVCLFHHHSLTGWFRSVSGFCKLAYFIVQTEPKILRLVISCFFYSLTLKKWVLVLHICYPVSVESQTVVTVWCAVMWEHPAGLSGWTLARDYPNGLKYLRAGNIRLLSPIESFVFCGLGVGPGPSYRGAVCLKLTEWDQLVKLEPGSPGRTIR